jgi:hypothetical protein
MTWRMRSGRAAQFFDFPGDESGVPPPFQTGHEQAQKGAGHDLGIKGLGGGHRHFDIAAAAGVEDAVDLEGQVRIPSIDDGQGVGAAFANHVDGAVGVRRGARLADGDHQGVGHAQGSNRFRPG